MCFPVIIAALGVVVGIISSILVSTFYPVKQENHIDTALRLNMILATVLMAPGAYFVTITTLPSTFHINGISGDFSASNIDAWYCVVSGTLGGLLIGFVAEYYTSCSFAPVLGLVHSCTTGAATNIIAGSLKHM